MVFKSVITWGQCSEILGPLPTKIVPANLNIKNLLLPRFSHFGFWKMAILLNFVHSTFIPLCKETNRMLLGRLELFPQAGRTQHRLGSLLQWNSHPFTSGRSGVGSTQQWDTQPRATFVQCVHDTSTQFWSDRHASMRFWSLWNVTKSYIIQVWANQLDSCP